MPVNYYVNPEAAKNQNRAHLERIGVASLVVGGLLFRKPLGLFATKLASDLAGSHTIQRFAQSSATKVFGQLELLSSHLKTYSGLAGHFETGHVYRSDISIAEKFLNRDLSRTLANHEISRLLPEALRVQRGWGEEAVSALMEDQGFFESLLYKNPNRTKNSEGLRELVTNQRGAFYRHITENHSDDEIQARLLSAANDLSDVLHGGNDSGSGYVPGIVKDIRKRFSSSNHPLKKTLSGIYSKDLIAEAKSGQSAYERLFGIEREVTSLGEQRRYETALGIKTGSLKGLKIDSSNAKFSIAGRKYDLSGLASIGRTLKRFLNEGISIPFSPFQTSVSPGQLLPFFKREGDIKQLGVLNNSIKSDTLQFHVRDKVINFHVVRRGQEDPIEILPGNFEQRLVNKRHLRNLAKSQTESPLGFNDLFSAKVTPGTIPYWDAPFAFMRKFKSREYIPNLLTNAAKGDIKSDREIFELIHAMRHGARTVSDDALLLAHEGLEARGISTGFSELARKITQSGGSLDSWAHSYEDLRTFLSNNQTSSPRVRRLIEDLEPLRSDPRAIRAHLNRTASFRASRDPEKFLGIQIGTGNRRLTNLDILRHDLMLDFVGTAHKKLIPASEFADIFTGTKETSSIALAYASALESIAYSSGTRGMNAFINSHPQVQEILSSMAKKRGNFLDLQPRESEHWEDFTLRSKLISINKGIPFEESYAATRAKGLGKFRSILETTSWKQKYNSIRAKGSSVLGAIVDSTVEELSSLKRSFWDGGTKDQSEASLGAYWLTDRLHDAFENLGWGLPDAWRSSPGKLATGILFGRILPITQIPEAHKLYNRLTRDIPILRWANLDTHREHLLRGYEHFSHKIINHKHLTALFPGLDFYTDDRTDKEERIHERYGDYTPVRKGRWWIFGSREFIGGSRVSYYLPSGARIASSDWQSASNVNLNDHYYWMHWGGYLNPSNWGKGAYWRERLHSKDQAVIMSSSAFDPDYAWSSPLNFLLSGLKPRKLYHPEVIPNRLGGTLEQHLNKNLNHHVKVTPGAVILSSLDSGGGVNPQSVVGTRFLNSHSRLKDPRLSNTDARLETSTDLSNISNDGITPEQEAFIRGIRYDSLAERGLYHLQELSGLYGWMAGQIYPELGRPQGVYQVEDPSRMSGVEHRFWNQEVGGILGTPADILRRFFPHRRRSIKDFNPLENNMPQWLPEEFLTGNPYTKIPMGELRLPGEAYCVSPDTLIETINNTLSRADTISSGDMIKTHMGRYLPVKKVIIRDVNKGEKVFKITASTLSAFPFTISEEHPVLTATVLPKFRKGGRGNTTIHNWVKAEDLKIGDYVAYPLPKNETTPHIIDMKEVSGDFVCLGDTIYYGRGSRAVAESYQYINRYKSRKFKLGERKELLECMGWSVSDFQSAQELVTKNHKHISFPRYIEVTEDIATLFGYWVAEGWTEYGNSIFAFHKDEVSYRDEIDSIVYKLLGRNGHISYPKDTNGALYKIGSIPLERLFVSQFSSGARNKTLPNWLYASSDSIKYAFLRALFNGDGWVTDSGESRLAVSLKTASINLAYGISRLLIGLGLTSSSIQTQKPRTTIYKKTGAVINSGISYTVCICAEDAVEFSTKVGYDIKTTTKNHRKLHFTDNGYLYLRVNKIEEVSTVKQVIGFEVDEDDSFCVAGVATHNTKTHPGVEEGMYRMRASSLGGTKEQLKNFLMNKEGDGKTSEAAEKGTLIHRTLQKHWKELGIQEAEEISVYDKEANITGHIDSILRMKTKSGNLQRTIVDIKTKSRDRFNAIIKSGKPEEENLEQIQFYMHTTGIHHALLTYVDRDDMNRVFEVPVEYNPLLWDKMKAKLDSARSELKESIRKGDISSGVLYSPVDKFEILSDVSAGSDEFRKLSQWASQHFDDLSPDEQYRVEDARKRLKRKREGFELHAYRFQQEQGALVSRNIKVGKILSNTQIEDTEGRKYSLAGITIDKVQSPHETAEEQWEKEGGIKEGTRVQVLLNRNDVDKDSAQAVVLHQGTNIAKRLLRLGLAEEDSDNYSAAAVRNRFTQSQVTIGKIFEHIAHTDSMLNTKFLPTRSGLEQYERTDVYGKKSGSWDHSLRDFIFPTIASFANKSVPEAAVAGGVFGFLFGSWAKERLLFTEAGAALGVVTSIIGKLGTNKHQPPIPSWVRKRREIEEYYDNLTYLKYTALANREADLAWEREQTNVNDLDSRYGNISIFARRKLEKLAGEAVGFREARRSIRERLDSKGLSSDKRHELREELNSISILEKQNHEDRAEIRKDLMNVGPHALRAMLYAQRAKETVYWTSESTSVDKAIAAQPNESRSAIADVIHHGSRREKQRLYDLLPDYQKSSLGYYLGVDPRKIPKRKALSEYFKHHPLPNSNWAGWRPDISLDLIEAKDIVENHKNLDPIDFGIYPGRIEEATLLSPEASIQTPPHTKPSLGMIQTQIEKLLSGKGLLGLRVRVEEQPPVANQDQHQAQVNFKVHHKREHALLALAGR